MPKNFLRPYASRISFLQRLLDAFLIFFVYWIGFVLHDNEWDTKRILVSLLAAVFFALFAEIKGLYNSWRINSLMDEIRTLLSIWLIVVSTLLMLAFATKTSEIFSRLVVLTWFVAAPTALIIVRLSVRGLLRYIRRHGTNTRTVAVVGNNPVGHRLIKHFDSMPWSGLVVDGIFDHQREELPVNIESSTYFIASIDDLIEKARTGAVDSVYVALPLKNEQLIEELVNQFADTTVSVYVVPDLFISELMHSRWVNFGGIALVSVYETPFYGLYGWAKQAEDFILGSLILPLIFPLMIAIAVAIKATSPGPVLFKQRRYGLNGAVVEVWKFRSMAVCEDGENIPQAQKGDKRVTALGAFLRRTSLDELPQFINVLQGSMSVVGPRPHALAHNEQYRKLIKGYMLRHKVKPGITGWAQVNGWRGETDTLDKMQKRIEYDLEYIQNWSLWFDLKIVVLTIVRGFTGKNVY
ncbi:undecaprenyl-phosphate glucose phosphotransferase [Candidatus Methylobacter oryzae]|uniref:undecaprenyl-phosphate glucose phosphotransferase n=1 Tax=Candidatus Methylobacter oryzae TaxID=2497749 RepID=UPI000F8E5CDD|nr:undecaprenyl-phosphate glucose phosphotransferase [Candidatus Methylobacter oryzae]